MEQPRGAQQAAQASFATTGGEGEESYARNSLIQNRLGACLQPVLRDALLHHFSPPQAGPIYYADFGCSVGANTVGFAKLVVETLALKQELRGREIVCYFSDLPSNDFNTLFNQLPPIADHDGDGDGDGSAEKRTWFAAGVPGSQYSRLFPRSSLHVAITTLSLHYLPEVPKSVVDKSSPAYNKGCVCCHGARPAAAEAFAEASRNGLRTFFECRAAELAPGGLLAFFCMGRRDRAHPEQQHYDGTINGSILLGLEKSWRELVNEGVIAEELLDSFNSPLCAPSLDEVREAIEHPTSAFHIQTLEFIGDFRSLPDGAEDTLFKDAPSFAKFLENTLRAGASSTLIPHMGPELTEKLFVRFRHNTEKDYPKWKAAHFPMYTNVCVAALIRK